MDSSIQKTYHDALFYASAPINKDKQFYLTPSELKVLLKLIHYSTSHEDITFQNKDISTHIFLSETTIKNSIESLLRKKYISSTRDIFNNRLGFKSKRTIYINWTFIEDIAKIIINTEKTAFTKIKYQSKDGTPKEADTSSYDEGGTCVNINKTNRVVLSNDNSKEVSTPQQEEIVPQIKDNTSGIESWLTALPTTSPQPKIEEIEEDELKDYKFYNERLLNLFSKRRIKGEQIYEFEAIKYLKEAWYLGKITKVEQVTIANLNRIIDKFRK